MSAEKLESVLREKLVEMNDKGILKGKETVMTAIKQARGEKGPRYLVQGYGEKEFVRLNSNSYLGMSLQKEIIEAEEAAARKYGTGPGAVRFISGTFEPHVTLENNLAAFHQREAAMIVSSAYATVMGTITPLIDPDTVVISDALNHNCIINAIRLAQTRNRVVYDHLDMKDLEEKLKMAAGQGKRAVIITDGIFSMRGDHAPLDSIMNIARRYETEFDEGVITVVDDSHGVGAFGRTGRGTEEYTNSGNVDILIATLGKAFGVNGGYVVAGATIIDYLRETAPFYIYSNPITPSEAAASLEALNILNSNKGKQLLEKLRKLTKRFEDGLVDADYEIIRSEHPIVPIMIRDTEKTSKLVRYMTDHGILATGLKYPVVPRGDEEIRCQVSADHTEHDIDYVLGVLRSFSE